MKYEIWKLMKKKIENKKWKWSFDAIKKILEIFTKFSKWSQKIHYEFPKSYYSFIAKWKTWKTPMGNSF